MVAKTSHFQCKSALGNKDAWHECKYSYQMSEHSAITSNSYTMHAKAASVLSARAQGRSPRARADAAFACMVQLIYS